MVVNNKRVVIIANGEIGREDFYKGFFLQDDYVICANGGVLNAEKLKIKPDLIIGDLDSCRKNFERYSCEIITFPPEKDKTDTELAIDFARKIKPDEVIIIGALGKRIDHSIANIYLVLKEDYLGAPITIMDSYQEIRLISGELYINKCKVGEVVSLIPLTREVYGIVTTGLKYRLKNESLFMGYNKGISNEIESIPVSIKIESGLLLFIRNFLNLDKL